MGERRLCKPEVTGSIPVISTKDVIFRSFPNCSLTIEYGLGNTICQTEVWILLQSTVVIC